MPQAILRSIKARHATLVPDKPLRQSHEDTCLPRAAQDITIQLLARGVEVEIPRGAATAAFVATLTASRIDASDKPDFA